MPTLDRSPLVLALDQGTTSSRAILFDRGGAIVAMAQVPTTQLYPHPGWVNQDAGEIWESTRQVAARVLAEPGALGRVAAVGITNQRETTILWDRATGEPVGPAIVWQSRQSAPIVERLKRGGYEERIQEITGLVPDAYFSATKIAWLLEHDPGLRPRAEAGELAFGTVDSWLIWNLTAGRSHIVDVTNASRTMLLDLRHRRWSDELLALLDIPGALLPEIVDSAGEIATIDATLFGRAMPVGGIAGDQQAALFGQACYRPGQAKNTYGTGSFVLMNVGGTPARSTHRLLSTIAWEIDSTVSYALEGAIFNTGSAVQWLRDGLGIIATSADVEPLAASVEDTDEVMFVPALTGLGSPDWDAGARGTILGITRGTTAAHIARATLEAIALQTRDVVDAMVRDSGVELAELRVDGGAAANNLLLQIQADVLGVPVVRPTVTETTALGAAYLAGLGGGVWVDQSEIASLWRQDRRFEPTWSDAVRHARYQRWREAVRRAGAWSNPPAE